MLQQTRVQAVLPYFERFMAAAPDVPALAELAEERLLSLWQGLGYYSRARSLQRSARVMVDQYGGCLPDTYSDLIQLPGIGDYTAGAILSIAFNKAVPAVDGNVLRIAARLTACGDNVLDPRTRQHVRDALAAVMPTDRPGDFNQAMMDLGAAVCLPKIPTAKAVPPQAFVPQRLRGFSPGCRCGKKYRQAGKGPDGLSADHPRWPHSPAPPPGNGPALRPVGVSQHRGDADGNPCGTTASGLGTHAAFLGEALFGQAYLYPSPLEYDGISLNRRWRRPSGLGLGI